MHIRPLSGVRIVDLGIGMAAAIAAKIMADAGAELVRFEPPAGDPFHDVYPAYAHWRDGVEVRPYSEESLGAALAEADIAIIGGEDWPGLDWRHEPPRLRLISDRLIILDLTAAPQGSEEFPAVELFAQAKSGFVFTHYPEQPLHFALPVASYGAALHGAIGALAALWARGPDGAGDTVTASLLSGALRWGASVWAEAERPSPAFATLSPKGVLPMRFECADGGHVALAPGGIAGGMAALYEILGIQNSGMDKQARGSLGGADPRHFFGDIDLLAGHIKSWKQADILAAVRARGIPGAPVRTAGACWDDPQTVENGIIETLPDGAQRVGSPLRFLPGERAQGGGIALHRSDGGPLAGARLVDLGSFAAGPHASVVLRDLGADVIKIERIEGDPMRPQFHHYAASNRGKRSIAVNAKAPEGAQLIRRLCARADAVHNNSRPGVSKRLGLDHEALSDAQPGIVVLESPAYGFTGPRALDPGFDSVLQAETGHQPGAGGDGNPPLSYRFAPIDYATGVIGALGMVLGLLLRQRHGQGVAVYGSLFNSGIFLLSELTRSPDGSFAGAPMNGPSQRGSHPAEGLYRAADGWIAVAARDPAMAARLSGALSLDLGPRAGWEGDAEAAIASAIRVLKRAQVLALLKEADVWAVACASDVDVPLADPSTRKNNLVIDIEDAELGRFTQIGCPVTFERFVPDPRGTGQIAGVGEHSRQILQEAGLEAEEIDVLFASGTVA